jgi:hypothetical protein
MEIACYRKVDDAKGHMPALSALRDGGIVAAPNKVDCVGALSLRAQDLKQAASRARHADRNGNGWIVCFIAYCPKELHHVE